MIADLGFATVLIALCASIFAVGAASYGKRIQNQQWVESARNAVSATFWLMLLANSILVYLIWTNDFSVQYVADVTSYDTPQYLKVTALWGGQRGSLLFWNLLLSLFTAASMRRNWNSERQLMPYVIAVSSVTQAFFIFISAFIENPFVRASSVVLDGAGLNPLLRHPGMIIHPPMLYLGFVGFTVPYSFAMAALISGKLDDGWIRTTRRWTLVAWLFLSLGLILGGRWAYDVLGWGGYWAWDPVENASFMPWLAGTAFLHSVMIQEKRGMFKTWNLFLVILTYLLVIFGTFIVRSGLVSSVHTFAQSNIGWYFFAFIAVMIVFSAYWLIERQDKLGSKNQLESLLSREAAFLLNNFLILGILAATFLGVMFPVITELFGDKITVGEPYYEKVNGPLLAALELLMGVAPLTMWHKSVIQKLKKAVIAPIVLATIFVIVLAVLGIRNVMALIGVWCVTVSAELTLLEFWKAARARMKSRGENPFVAFSQLFVRNQRRYGGYLIHLGVIVMAFGIIGLEFFQQQTQIRMTTGDSLTLGRYSMTFNGTRQYPGPDDLLINEADVDIFLNGRLVKSITPHINVYQRTGQPMTIPDLRSTPLEDFYVLLVNWESVTPDSATVKVYLNPLVNWVWAGGVIFVIGTAIAAWPDPQEARVIAASRRFAVSTD